MIPNGALVTYTGQWKTTLSQLADSLISDISVALNGLGLPVKQQSNTASFWSTGFLTPFQVTLQMQVEGAGFSGPDDVIALVRHAVFSVTGDYPISDSLPYVQAPGGTAQSTGQPGQTTPQGTGCIAGGSSDLTNSFSFSCWFSNLTQTGLASVGFLGILAATGVGIALYFGMRPKHGEA
jgi:hypothetical protein